MHRPLRLATSGRDRGSPAFRDMFKWIPGGGGYVVMGASYLAKRSCHTIAYIGRASAIRLWSDLRVRKLHPADFGRACPRRSRIGDVFQAIGEGRGKRGAAQSPAQSLCDEGAVARPQVHLLQPCVLSTRAPFSREHITWALQMGFGFRGGAGGTVRHCQGFLGFRRLDRACAS